MKHICGQCGRSFNTESAYLKHQCPATTAAASTKATMLSEKDILAAVKAARQAKKT